ncbi:hypothetical protein C8R46DRAFT_895220, partial [Mycena filopes]
RDPSSTRLDLARMVSFYDPALAPSLVEARAGVERWEHRVRGISAADLSVIKARLREVLTTPLADAHVGGGSGVDWQTLYHVIVDRYADRLELVGYLLNTTTPANSAERARIIQTQLRIMLTPYILYSARPPSSGQDLAQADDAWAAPVWHACATRHTAHIHNTPQLRAKLTPSEETLLRALDETTGEVCRVLTRMWAMGVSAGFDPLIPLPISLTAPNNGTEMEMERVVRGWQADAVGLVGWLDWGVWVKCRPACGVEVLHPSPFLPLLLLPLPFPPSIYLC